MGMSNCICQITGLINFVAVRIQNALENCFEITDGLFRRQSVGKCCTTLMYLPTDIIRR